MRNCIKKYASSAVLIIAATILSGCLGSGGGGTTASTADTTAPTTTAAPSVTGTTDAATTLSVTINEDGTGYYLVRLATDPAPTVAEVQAGTSFALTANVAATPAISGLVFNTAYMIYFVAKDAAGNVQAVVQSVAVTTAPTTAVGYVTQGGLTWMPVFSFDTWTRADALLCTNTTYNGVTGWRMPTQPELSALYNSGAMNGQGWALGSTWSSTQFGAGTHAVVNLNDGSVNWNTDTNFSYVSCVR